MQRLEEEEEKYRTLRFHVRSERKDYKRSLKRSLKREDMLLRVRQNRGVFQKTGHLR